MGTITLTLPSAGTQITAGLHAANYAAIQAAINGDIDAANIEAGAISNTHVNAAAAIAVSKLAAGSNGQLLSVTAGVPTWVDDAGIVHYRKVTEKDVVNTTTETDLLDGGITIGAGAMGTNKFVRATLIGDYLNNSAATRTLNIEVGLGGTVLWEAISGNIAVSANRRPFRFQFEIVNLGANNVQFTNGWFSLGNVAAPTTGIGSWGQVISSDTEFRMTNFAEDGTSAVDTSAACALTVKVTHSTNNANLSCRLKAALVEVI